MSWLGKPATSKMPTEVQLDLVDIETASWTLEQLEDGVIRGPQADKARKRIQETIEDIKRRHGWR